jgi:phosphatidylethanolamine-binding protein (PEBP) family uncharacterized protein
MADTAAAVASEPAVYFAGDAAQTYALIMYDPDPPAVYGPAVRHWIVSDLKPSCTVGSSAASKGTVQVRNSRFPVPWVIQCDIDDSCSQSAYVGPAPQGDSPFHRYVQLLYVQPRNAKFTPFNASDSVVNFNVSAYVAQVGLKGPVAGNFFLIEDYGQNE